MKILVTGATGLLGRVVSLRLASNGFDVIRVVTPWSTESPSADTVAIDLADNWVYKDLPGQVDVVIHLAQSNSFRDFPSKGLDLFNVNVSSTFKLLDYARRAGTSAFIYTSTGGLYEASRSILTEESTLHNNYDLGAYYGSKLSAEILIQAYSRQFDTTILRPFFMYGRGQKRSMLIPRIFDRVRTAEPINLVGNEGLIFNPIHVTDAAAALCAAVIHPPKKIVNLAGPKIYSLRLVAEIFGQFLGVEPVFEHRQLEGTQRGVESLVADTGLMGELLHPPIVALEDSVEEMVH